MNVPSQIVVASASLEDRQTMVNILAEKGLDPIVASSVAACREIMAQENVGLIFCARSLADGDCRDLLLAARASKRGARIVLTARITDWDEYLDAMRLGAFDVISAPCRPTDRHGMDDLAGAARRTCSNPADFIRATSCKRVAARRAQQVRVMPNSRTRSDRCNFKGAAGVRKYRGEAPRRVLLRAAEESELLRSDSARSISRRSLAAFPRVW